MSEDKRYNGWANYETWAWKLWLDNDEGTYDYWREVAGDMLDKHNNEDASYYLSKELKEQCQADNPLGDSNSAYVDLLGAAISEIDFYEIAESMVNDLLEEELRQAKAKQ